jgi:hypothetical protein
MFATHLSLEGLLESSAKTHFRGLVRQHIRSSCRLLTKVRISATDLTVKGMPGIAMVSVGLQAVSQAGEKGCARRLACA